MVMCPETKEWLAYDAVEKRIREIASLSVAEKVKRCPNGIRLNPNPKAERPWKIDQFN
jgi:hypothetical protein